MNLQIKKCLVLHKSWIEYGLLVQMECVDEDMGKSRFCFYSPIYLVLYSREYHVVW